MSFSPLIYIPLNGVYSSVVHTGTLVRTALHSFVIKGGSIGGNDVLIYPARWTCTNSANNKTYEVEFGSTNFFNLTQASQANYSVIKYVQNRNSLTSQISSRLADVPSYLTNTAALVTMAENTANDITVTFYATLANDTETITLTFVQPYILKSA